MHLLEQQILGAFGCDPRQRRLDAEDYPPLKWKLVAMEDESAKRWLPLLLVHEVRSAPTSEGDALVYFLDADLRGRAGRPEVESRRLEAQATFAKYDDAQVKAIVAWLEQVALPHYGDLCREDIDSALRYWRSRMKDVG